jgi:hypothetical protein
VTIEWRENVSTFDVIADPQSKLPHLDEKGFYAILASVRDTSTNKWNKFDLLYIGQAFDQTLRERISQPHDAYTCVNAKVKETEKTAIVMVGFIKQASVENITQSLLDDIECCLIYSNKPRCNIQCKDEYKGQPLKITNTGGYQPLKANSEC